MISWLYWTAAAGAVTGGLAGNRLAWPLLCSAAFCLYARTTELPFDLALWVTVDLVVAIGVLTVLLTRRPARREWAVVALFLPMWLAYALHPGPAHIVSTLAGAAQFLLVLPDPRQAWLRVRSFNSRFDAFRHFDWKVAA